MGKRLERTRIEQLPLLVEPLSQATIGQLNSAIRARKTPFTDDITTAEKVSDLESFRYGAQQRGTKNIAEIGRERALKRGAIGRAAIYRLLELSLMHGAIAAENQLAVQGTLRAVRRGVDPDPDVLARTADTGLDLAHGLQKTRFLGTDLGKELPGVVYVLSERLREEVGEADTPFLGVLANDAISKTNFWTGAYRRIQQSSGQVIKSDRVHALFTDPAQVETLLRVSIPHQPADRTV